MTRRGGWLVGLAFAGVATYAIAEDLTLTTYYPSPRGVYEELRARGDVAIGTTSTPVARLHVVGAGGVAHPLRVEAPGGPSSPFEINSNGEVGIHTSSPGYPLDVAGTIRATGFICPSCVGSAGVNFNYANSSSKGGPATDVACATCVTLGTETTGNYAGSTSAGGPATTLALSPAPALCPNGQYARGITTGGNATGCTSASLEAPSSGITSINTMTGPAITIAQGSGITISSASNTVTISAPGLSSTTTGSGLTDYLTKWQTGSQLTSADELYAKGGRMGIGVVPNDTTVKLDVIGVVRLSGDLKDDQNNVIYNNATNQIPAARLPSLDGTDCVSGRYARGIDGSGNATGCTAFALTMYTASAGPSYPSCVAQCNPGDHVTGGGCDYGGTGANSYVSRPSGDDGWECIMQTSAPGALAMCFARCLRAF